MLIIVNLFSLFLYFFTFTFPLCFDRVINKFNINEEFLIKNVDGIGKVSITNDFRHLVELNFGPLISGFCICDEFAKYARLELCLNSEQMLKVDHAMTHYNTMPENLIPINKLVLGFCVAFS